VSAGAQENLPTGGAGTVTPRVPPGMLGRVFARGGDGPRFSRLKSVPFVILLTFISVLALYPFVWLVSASLKPQGDVFDNELIPDRWQWNYTGDPTPVPGDEKLFNLPDVPVLHWVWNSVWIGLLAAFVVAFSSAIVAFAFAYFRFPGRNLLFALILATMMLPGAVTMVPTYLIWDRLGLASTQVPLWAGNLFGSAFYIFLLRQFFLSLPRDLFEAALIDGASYLRLFRSIALPLAKPALVIVFVFELRASWTDLVKPLIYLRDPALYTIPRGLKAVIDQFGKGGESQWEIVLAASVLTTLPMIVLFFLGQRHFVEGIATTGRGGA
jgi:multiple sugar transport system permease protein